MPPAVDPIAGTGLFALGAMLGIFVGLILAWIEDD
jgi:hypothetical protein